MKIKIFLGFLVLLILTGCAEKVPVQTKIEYRYKECPTPKIKPIFKEYEMVILKINGEEYYALQKSEAIKMSTNWISYKEWAESNYILLNSSKVPANTINTTKIKK